MSLPATQQGPLEGIHVVTIALNVPGPVAVQRLARLGARVTSVLPPTGDPLKLYQPAWYDDLHEGHTIEEINLKDEGGRARLAELLDEADLFVTSHRPSALARLGISPDDTAAAHPRLCRIDIVGDPGEAAEHPGHDLTYQASIGLLSEGRMPRTLIADMAGAECAVSAALAALFERERTGRGVRREVALSTAAYELAEPLRQGLTAPGGILGGGTPIYDVYAASDGHVALAALEPHFQRNAAQAWGIGQDELTKERITEIIAGRTVAEWEAWAAEHDVPLGGVR